MGQELTQLLCPECAVPGESDPKLSRWQCTSCGNAFYLRRCSACAGVCYVDGLQGFRMPWPCTWCGQFNRGFNQNQDPATVTAFELAAEVARYGLGHKMAAADRDLTPAPPATTDGAAFPGFWLARNEVSAIQDGS